MKKIFLLIGTLLAITAMAQNLAFQNNPLLGQAQINNLPQSGLIAWWKADYFDQFSLTNNAPIGNITNNTTWVDSTGNGHDLTNKVFANMPVYSTGAFNNGRAGISFAGGTKVLFMLNSLNMSNWTIMAVYKCTTSLDGIILGNSSINRQVRRQQNVLRTFDGNAEAISPPMFVTTANPHMAVWSRFGTSVDLMVCTNLTTATTNLTDNSAQMVLDEMGDCPSVIQPFTGTFAEIAVYSPPLTTNQIVSIYTNYFRPKWALNN